MISVNLTDDAAASSTAQTMFSCLSLEHISTCVHTVAEEQNLRPAAGKLTEMNVLEMDSGSLTFIHLARKERILILQEETLAVSC